MNGRSKEDIPPRVAPGELRGLRNEVSNRDLNILRFISNVEGSLSLILRLDLFKVVLV
jgi:hypothetical protein